MIQFFLGQTSGLHKEVRLRYKWRMRASGYVPGILASQFDGHCPISMTETADGLLMLTNGIDLVHRWDGVSPFATPVGVHAPQTAPRLDSRGFDPATATAISEGDGRQFVEFDYSDFHDIGTLGRGRFVPAFSASYQKRLADWNRWHAKFIDEAAARLLFFGRPHERLAAIENSTYWDIPPSVKFSVEIRVVASEEDEVSADTTPRGPISGVYSAFQRFVDAFNNPSDPSPLATEITADGAAAIIYTEVETPTDPKVVKRQLFRSTAGEFQDFYLDVETTNLTATQFESTKSDVELQMQPALALMTADSQLLAYLFGVPPSHKTSIVSFNNHVFLMGENAFTEGCAKVTRDSASVTGIGTEWRKNFAGRFFYTPSSPAGTEILLVDEDTQVITLAAPHQGATDNYSEYAIKAAPAERNLVYWCEPGQPEAWPASNALSLEEDGDEITGGGVHNGSLYIMKRENLYRMAFALTPAVDGSIRQVARRGCINEHCAVSIDGMTFMLDNKGVHAVDDSGLSQPLSFPINDLFRPEGSDSGYSINWRATCAFHAVHQPDLELIRWFVCMSGHKWPRHALCFQYSRKVWWIESYPFPVPSSANVFLAGIRPVVGGPAAKVFAIDRGALDVVNGDDITTRGAITDFSIMSLTLDFEPDESCIGAPIAIVSGRAKGQTNLIVGLDENEVFLKWPLTEHPSTSGDEASVAQIGSIDAVWHSSDFQLVEMEKRNPRDVQIDFRSTEDEAGFDVKWHYNGSADAAVAAIDRNEDYIRSTKDQAGVEIDSRNPRGMVKMPKDGWQERDQQNRHLMSLKVEVKSGAERIRLNRIIVQGVVEKDG